MSRLRNAWMSLLWAAIALTFGSLSASAQQWQQMPGAAHDVGVGAGGAVWVVGADEVEGGYRVWRYDGGTWKATQAAGVRIAVAPNGGAWVVDDKQEILRISADGAQVTREPRMKARDVGVGADGAIWIIGDDAEAGGYGIHRRTASARWKKVAGAAMRISVDPSGNPWVVNNTSNIFRYDGQRFVQLPGAATDIGVGADGAAWIIGTDGGIYRWEGANWAKKTGGAAQVAAGAAGAVWVVNAGGAIFQAQLGATPSQVVVAPPSQVIVAPPTAIVSTPPPPVVIQPPVLMAVPPPQQPPSGTIVMNIPMGPVITSATPAPSSTPAAPIDPRNPWRVFPRGGQYEALILKAMGFQDFPNRVFLGGQAPAASTLTPLERAFADIALSATESHFAARPLSPDEEIAYVRNDVVVRASVITLTGMGVSGRVRETRRDAETTALRQWAGEVFRTFKVETAKATLDQYRLWAADPCGYERLSPSQCRGIAGLLSPPRPSQDVIVSNALGAVLSSHARETAAATAVGLAVASMTASAAALATSLGVAAGTVTASGGFGGAVSWTVSTSLFAAFGGTTTSLTTGAGTTLTAAMPQAAGAMGAASWVGVVAAPVTAAIMIVVVGTTEGVAVVEGVRVEPMLKLKLGAAMTEGIVIQNELQEQQAGDFFLIAYQDAAAGGFYVPKNTVDGEARFFCQAGYICRFKLDYAQGGAKSFSTGDLSAGMGKTYAIPYNATNIVASGEYFDGSAWKSLFTKNIAKPTYIGFTAYGTFSDPKYKDEYPEISNIQAPAGKLVVTQGGGYVAWIRVSYTQNGVSNRVVDVSNASGGWRQEVTIPTDARDIHLEAWSNTGWVGEPWKTIIDKTWPAPPNVCIKTYNTTQEPKWNNECN
jgi:hypothetical protein